MIFLLLMAIHWILYGWFRKCKTHWRKAEIGEIGWDGPMGLQFMAHPSELTKKHWWCNVDIMGKKREYYDMWGLSHYIIMILYYYYGMSVWKLGPQNWLMINHDQPWFTSPCAKVETADQQRCEPSTPSLSKIDPVNLPNSQRWFFRKVSGLCPNSWGLKTQWV